MPYTTSLNFPNMFSVASGRVVVKEDEASVINRCRLLLLSDPKSLYNSPQFGAGLRQFIWQYNSPNTQARMEDVIKEQLRKYEPCVVPSETQFNSGLISKVDPESALSGYHDNTLNLTVVLKTIFGDVAEVKLNDVV